METNMNNRQVIRNIFFVLITVLVILPFATTFSEILAKVLLATPVSVFIQNYIVPFETRIVGVILHLIGAEVGVSDRFLIVSGRQLDVTWNCLGWQSLLFLLISFFTGLQGQFKFTSKVEAAAIGILGTFWVNIARIVFISILGGYFPSIFAVVFHDYFATLITALWLFFFWWFTYTFVLEERSDTRI